MHLYGGAAAMLDDVMRVPWEVDPIYKRGSYLIKSNKCWQVHLYGEAARCVPEISNPRVVEGELGRCLLSPSFQLCSEKRSEKGSDQGSEKGSVKGFGKGAGNGKGKGKGKGKGHK